MYLTHPLGNSITDYQVKSMAQVTTEYQPKNFALDFSFKS